MKPLLDVLIILDALEKEGSFAAASAKLYKTPSALSYTVQKLESDLNIQILDRSGHRARFTRTGQMLLEKGRDVLHTVRELEKQAVKLHQGWENELVIGVDDTFPFSLLTPLIEMFYQHHSVTRLIFINGVLGGSWDALTQGRADIFVGALHEPPQLSEFGFARLGVLEQVFAVAPHHPLAQEPEPLNRRVIKGYRAIVWVTALARNVRSPRNCLMSRKRLPFSTLKPSLSCKLAVWAAAIYPAIWRSALLTAVRLLKNRYLLKTAMNRSG